MVLVLTKRKKPREKRYDVWGITKTSTGPILLNIFIAVLFDLVLISQATRVIIQSNEAVAALKMLSCTAPLRENAKNFSVVAQQQNEQ